MGMLGFIRACWDLVHIEVKRGDLEQAIGLQAGFFLKLTPRCMLSRGILWLNMAARLKPEAQLPMFDEEDAWLSGVENERARGEMPRLELLSAAGVRGIDKRIAALPVL